MSIASKNYYESLVIGKSLIYTSKDSVLTKKGLSWTVRFLEKCIAQNTITLIFNKLQECCGLAIWINVSESVSHRLLNKGLESLQLEEMDSGSETWIIDLVAMGGSLTKLLRKLRDECLADRMQVTYFRVKCNSYIAKRISRTDNTSFFKRSDLHVDEDTQFILTKKAEGLRHSALANQRVACSLGEVAMLAQHIHAIGILPIEISLKRLSRPDKLQQSRRYYDTEKKLGGYISWAWLDSKLALYGVPATHDLLPHQWNEGTYLLICDAFATPACFSKVCSDLAGGLYPNETMHLRPDAPHGNTIQAIPISPKVLGWLNSIATDINQPVIDISALLRSRLSFYDGMY